MKLENTPILNNHPADTRRFPAAMDSMFRSQGMVTENMIPAKVLLYDRAQNIATVQPLVMLLDTGGNSYMRHQLDNLPVLSLGGGGFHISFPLQPGDLGWIFAPDRDISLVLQKLDAAPPNTNRLHKFEDAWFIPDVFRQYTINSEDSGAMVIQSTDGATRIVLRDGEVDIIAPTQVKITTPQAKFSGDVTVDGVSYLNGGMSTQKTGNPNCILSPNTTINGVNIATHGHNGVQSGSSRTGGGMVS